MSIVIKNLNYIYNKGTPFFKQALKDINLNICEGDFFGIIGHTGSGKSTLIQHFNALIKPAAGTVFVNGVDPAEKGANLKLLRSDVGMVFQYPEYQLFAETVYEDIAFGLKNFYKSRDKKSRKNVDKAEQDKEIEQKVRQAIEMVGLDFDEIKDKSPFDISGGQKRRVAIAGVIVTRPKILILDEPTAGLDPKGKKEIISLIHFLKKSFCPTVVMISHDMNEIAKNCSKIAVIKNGSIVCVKTPQELFSDNNIIKESGMDVPEAVKLTKMLEGKGLKFNYMPFSAEQMSDSVFSAIKHYKADKEDKNA